MTKQYAIDEKHDNNSNQKPNYTLFRLQKERESKGIFQKKNVVMILF